MARLLYFVRREPSEEPDSLTIGDVTFEGHRCPVDFVEQDEDGNNYRFSGAAYLMEIIPGVATFTARELVEDKNAYQENT